MKISKRFTCFIDLKVGKLLFAWNWIEQLISKHFCQLIFEYNWILFGMKKWIIFLSIIWWIQMNSFMSLIKLCLKIFPLPSSLFWKKKMNKILKEFLLQFQQSAKLSTFRPQFLGNFIIQSNCPGAGTPAPASLRMGKSEGSSLRMARSEKISLRMEKSEKSVALYGEERWERKVFLMFKIKKL